MLPPAIASGGAGKTVLLSGLVTGLGSALQARASQNKRGPTFVAGDISHGGGRTVDVPTYTFGKEEQPSPAVVPSMPVTPPVGSLAAQSQEPTVAGALAREEPIVSTERTPVELPGFVGGQGILGGFAEVGEVPPGEVEETRGILEQAQQPQFQNTNSFFGALPQATPIPKRSSRSDFEDRLFGGLIAGVS